MKHCVAYSGPEEDMQMEMEYVEQIMERKDEEGKDSAGQSEDVKLFK